MSNQLKLKKILPIWSHIMLPECFELTIEQEFNIRTIELNTLNVSAEQLRELFVEISRQLIVKDNIIRHLMMNNL